MRSLFAFAATAVLLSAGSASAREREDAGNTALTATPIFSTTSSMRAVPRGKRDANIPAKYDVAYPVRDRGQMMRDRGSI